ncbi:MAG: adenosylcobinamide-phosphate synthase CbiB [Lachnospiraceae bacterium]|jgi:adenosylcobinamide-phosphate synthase|nr:adenosylcobinamide-phosphate synthase CbiB [Lachnospiraceae bacterium]MCH4063907.1 adenosylcobinamide-phosphate synthase CbiB [Lachnospiraceae bacterium]MCH4103371.1 adenosylcobinamide-phosphate synthase CbiB [Lachnospiraceae bacterium]MCI1309320.1 adenosylcobinamide-phosphate synthase CbiB [Lachnospiraceae bacterium]MCI1333683.1 adenosylcobinamide-phosphate synthase CbiB [Lachnospiraceae bacterium]
MLAFFAGFVLDLIFGDPQGFPHPVRWIGTVIARLTDRYLKKAERGTKRAANCADGTIRKEAGQPAQAGERMSDQAEETSGSRKRIRTDGETGAERTEDDAAYIRQRKRRYGLYMVIEVILLTGLVPAAVLIFCYHVHPILGCAMEAFMTYQMLAAKSLRTESMRVYTALREGTLEDARHAVSMIVGRDTAQLDREHVAMAAVETVAENTSDGEIAPMLCFALGGPVLGWMYKAVNTMDSMVGYKNEKYIDFGRAAAKLDDAVNFLPSRISAYLMIFACRLCGKDYDAARAKRIYLRDRRKHASPNSAQTESACAGALGLRLAGDASYFGKIVKKPFIGDRIRPTEPEDIPRANRLMYATAMLCEGICLMILFLVYFRM